MATASQFIAQCFRERFSCFEHFLYFVRRKDGQATKAFSAFFLTTKGERCAKLPVHRVGHNPVHLHDSISRRRMKKV
jgi:hypothetical protein